MCPTYVVSKRKTSRVLRPAFAFLREEGMFTSARPQALHIAHDEKLYVWRSILSPLAVSSCVGGLGMSCRPRTFPGLCAPTWARLTRDLATRAGGRPGRYLALGCEVRTMSAQVNQVPVGTDRTASLDCSWYEFPRHPLTRVFAATTHSDSGKASKERRRDRCAVGHRRGCGLTSRVDAFRARDARLPRTDVRSHMRALLPKKRCSVPTWTMRAWRKRANRGVPRRTARVGRDVPPRKASGKVRGRPKYRVPLVCVFFAPASKLR